MKFVCGSLTLSILLAAIIGLTAQTRKTSMHEIPPAIERAHQQDIAATLSSSVSQLTELWTDDGVLIGAGAKPIVGKAAIQDFLAKSFAKNADMKVIKYEPEFSDLQISGDVAYEWGYFNAVQQASPSSQPTTFRARFLRVLRRQPDGSWKFSRVMWTPDSQ